MKDCIVGIVGRILAGDWAETARVPSENELTGALSVSRMTVHQIAAHGVRAVQ